MTDVLAEPEAIPVTLSPDWWAGGLTLAERCALPGTPGLSADADGRAGRRLARWREGHWLGGLDRLAGLLAQAEVDEKGLLALLGEDTAGLATRAAKPDWAREIESIVAALPTEPALPEPPVDDEVAGWNGLAAVVTPLVDRSIGRLAAAVHTDRLGAVVNLDGLRADLIAGLERTLVMLAGRTLALELHVLRVTGRLVGDTARERFWSFVHHYSRPKGFAGLLTEYPVLARLMVQGADRAVAGWLALLRRLKADRSLLVDTVFGGTDPGKLRTVRFDGTHWHDQRRAPALLGFVEGVRLAYRPHPLGGYACFHELVEFLNRRLPELKLRTPITVDRRSYGWVEFIEPLPPMGQVDQERLYQRWGGLLALNHTLGLAGLHDGDTVVCGDQPVLVDLANLFRPRLPTPHGIGADGDPAATALDDSVSRVSLLRTLGGQGGGAARRLATYSTLTWVAPGTDQMRLVRRVPPPIGQLVDGKPADRRGLATALLAGFGATYDALVAGRAELLGTSGLLWRFDQVESRFQVRPTAMYHALLTESLHPDMLRDALERDRLLGQLWTTAAGYPEAEQLAVAEMAALRVGRIPSFAARAGSRDVSANDDMVLPDVLSRAGLYRAADAIKAMGTRDRLAQEWIIRAWLAAQAPEASDDRSSPAYLPWPEAGDVDPQRCLALARRLADQLAVTAYHQGERVGWLGLTTLDERRWSVLPSGVGLYDGYSGVALFLAKLAELSGEERYAALARQALAHVPAMFDQFDGAMAVTEQWSCGPFHGITGLGYALTHVAASLGDETLVAGLVPPLAAMTMTTIGDAPDLLGGTAGCLAAMHAIDEAIDASPVRRVAQAAALRVDDWLTKYLDGGADGLPVGLARGGSGMGWALLWHAAATGRARSAELGQAIFQRERGVGLPGRLGWCEGAAGVGLARAGSLHAGDPGVAADLERAIKAVLAAGPLANHSLCHGELGCLELLTVVVERGRTDLAGVRQRRATAVLQALEQHGPRCGTPDEVPTPGLLTGLAGIGYGLLRQGFPDRVPSVLLLEPPRARLQGGLP